MKANVHHFRTVISPSHMILLYRTLDYKIAKKQSTEILQNIQNYFAGLLELEKTQNIHCDTFRSILNCYNFLRIISKSRKRIGYVTASSEDLLLGKPSTIEHYEACHTFL